MADVQNNAQSRRTVSAAVGDFDIVREPVGGWPGGSGGADGADGPAAGPAARGVRDTSDQVFATPLVPTRVAFNAETYDTAGDFDVGTGMFTASVAGLYRVSTALAIDNLDISDDIAVSIRVDGTAVATTFDRLWFELAGELQTVQASTVVPLSVGQEVDVVAYRPVNDVQFEVSSSANLTYVEVAQIGRVYPLP